jgi:hypothetical protein
MLGRVPSHLDDLCRRLYCLASVGSLSGRYDVYGRNGDFDVNR